MGPFATSVLIGCLNALRWLLWSTVGLIVVSMLAMLWRGETPVDPPGLLALALALAALGWACLWMASQLVVRLPD